MSRLAALQRDFQRFLLGPACDAVPPWVSVSGRAAPATQLAVYTSAYRARLKEVLALDFPALNVLLGEECFEELAHAYIDAHPSQGFTLRDFGGHMACFLRQQAGYKDRPFLGELAAFEWTLGQAFDAADVPVFTEQAMSALPAEEWPRLQLVLHPSVHRLDFVWNAPGLWKAYTSDCPKPVIPAQTEPVPWLIWRDELTTRFRSLEHDEHVALDAARGGATFVEMCETLSTAIPPEVVPLRAASLLKSWIGQGLISGIAGAGGLASGSPSVV